MSGTNAREHQVKHLIHQVSGIAIERIGLDDSLIVSLGLDSMEMIDLVMRLETCGVKIPSSQITVALTVRDVIALFTREAITEPYNPPNQC